MNAQDLKDKYDADLKALQESCKHEGAMWMKYEWAPGHYGNDVKTCPICWKHLEWKEPDGLNIEITTASFEPDDAA